MNAQSYMSDGVFDLRQRATRRSRRTIGPARMLFHRSRTNNREKRNVPRTSHDAPSSTSNADALYSVLISIFAPAQSATGQTGCISDDQVRICCCNLLGLPRSGERVGAHWNLAFFSPLRTFSIEKGSMSNAGLTYTGGGGAATDFRTNESVAAMEARARKIRSATGAIQLVESARRFACANDCRRREHSRWASYAHANRLGSFPSPRVGLAAKSLEVRLISCAKSASNPRRRRAV